MSGLANSPSPVQPSPSASRTQDRDRDRERERGVYAAGRVLFPSAASAAAAASLEGGNINGGRSLQRGPGGSPSPFSSFGSSWMLEEMEVKPRSGSASPVTTEHSSESRGCKCDVSERQISECADASEYQFR